MKGSWAEELPVVLWSYRTTPRGSTNQTPNALAFGSEAVVPIEIEMPSKRIDRPFDEQENLEALCINLDLL